MRRYAGGGLTFYSDAMKCCSPPWRWAGRARWAHLQYLGQCFTKILAQLGRRFCNRAPLQAQAIESLPSDPTGGLPAGKAMMKLVGLDCGPSGRP